MFKHRSQIQAIENTGLVLRMRKRALRLVVLFLMRALSADMYGFFSHFEGHDPRGLRVNGRKCSSSRTVTSVSPHSLNWYAKAFTVEPLTHGSLISDIGYCHVEGSPGSVAEMLYIKDSCQWICISLPSIVFGNGALSRMNMNNSSRNFSVLCKVWIQQSLDH